MLDEFTGDELSLLFIGISNDFNFLELTRRDSVKGPVDLGLSERFVATC